jgi:hypothetical protein
MRLKVCVVQTAIKLFFGRYVMNKSRLKALLFERFESRIEQVRAKRNQLQAELNKEVKSL